MSQSRGLWLLLPALLLAALPLTAQTAVEINRDVVYGHKDGMALTFDVFRPVDGANGVGILHMVSGGWVSRWSEPETAVNRYSFLLDQGFTVFSVRHGSSPRFNVPEAYSDVKRATRYINLHAADYGVDPARLGVYGSSAGGHLSLMLGLTTDDGDAMAQDPIEGAPSEIAAIVAYFPPTDLRRMVGPSESFPALNFEQELADSVSPLLQVSPDDPPTLLLHGDEDGLVNISHSENIYAAFNEEGVTSEFITYPGQGHGFRGDAAEDARDEVVEWFTEYLVNAPR